jgi:outer membrane usher protein FimD/PapC
VQGTQLVVGGTVVVGGSRLLGRAVSRAGRLEGGYSANGAVAFGSVRRATPLAYGGVGLSGIEGQVFQDRNGDGLFEAGEAPAAHVAVRVGGLRVFTDSAGRYSLWSAIPYEPLGVQLDSLSLDDPAWVPAVASRTLRPSPQQFTRVDFALVRTRELIGRLQGERGLPMPAGVAVELRDATSGALYRTRTFSDGAYYIGRVRPGRYEIVVAASSVRALGAATPPGVQVVVSADGEDVVEAPVVVLRAARVEPRP